MPTVPEAVVLKPRESAAGVETKDAAEAVKAKEERWRREPASSSEEESWGSLLRVGRTAPEFLGDTQSRRNAVPARISEHGSIPCDRCGARCGLERANIPQVMTEHERQYVRHNKGRTEQKE